MILRACFYMLHQETRRVLPRTRKKRANAVRALSNRWRHPAWTRYRADCWMFQRFDPRCRYTASETIAVLRGEPGGPWEADELVGGEVISVRFRTLEEAMSYVETMYEKVRE